jgi:DNA repair protein RecO (recombination protein O)
MKLESDGILIALRPFDEKNAVAHIFSRDHGVLVGMMRGALTTKTNRPLVGQTGSVSWNARLDSALGVFHWESEKNLSTALLSNTDKLSFMNAAFDLIGMMLPEREAYTKLYDETVNMLNALAKTDRPETEYLQWEIELLRELGYALDLSHCSGCGGTSDLIYLSPKTGRAVCSVCGAPYATKLYSLPITLNTTKFFLEKICGDMGIALPTFRTMISHKKF